MCVCVVCQREKREREGGRKGKRGDDSRVNQSGSSRQAVSLHSDDAGPHSVGVSSLRPAGDKETHPQLTFIALISSLCIIGMRNVDDSECLSTITNL